MTERVVIPNAEVECLISDRGELVVNVTSKHSTFTILGRVVSGKIPWHTT